MELKTTSNWIFSTKSWSFNRLTCPDDNQKIPDQLQALSIHRPVSSALLIWNSSVTLSSRGQFTDQVSQTKIHLYNTLIQPHQHPLTDFSPVLGPPAARYVAFLVLKTKPHLNTEGVTSRAWLVWPGAPGTEGRVTYTFLPFPWYHFMSLLHGGWNK